MGDDGDDTCQGFSLEGTHIRYPTSNAVSLKNFQNAVFGNFEKYNVVCINSRTSNFRKNHVRNKKLLDLPFKRAKCCTKIYNATLDRQKLKKLRKYNLSRPVRILTSDLEPEVIEKCDRIKSELISEEPTEHFVNECLEVFDDELSDQSADIKLEACNSGSLSECSGCSTIGPMKKLKFHEVPRLHWQDLLHGSQVEYCKNVIVKVLAKYKGRSNAILKLKKYYLK